MKDDDGLKELLSIPILTYAITIQNAIFTSTVVA